MLAAFVLALVLPAAQAAEEPKPFTAGDLYAAVRRGLVDAPR